MKVSLRPRLEWLLIFVPVAIALELLHGPALGIFAASSLAILPLAGIIGHGTEELAARSGPQLGGLLNATFGNVTELIIAFFLILENEIQVVKASISGAIIGNVLLILGLAFLAGGIRREQHTFNVASASLHSASLVIAVVALLMPALFSFTQEASGFRTEAVSVGVSVVLMTLYVSSLIFALITHRSLFRSNFESAHPKMSLSRALIYLAGATVVVGLMSEFLVGALEESTAELGLSKLFVGLIIVPIIGNAAEHSSAVFLAMKDRMDVAIETAIGSST